VPAHPLSRKPAVSNAPIHIFHRPISSSFSPLDHSDSAAMWETKG
jgi:hypothetical protein